MDLIYRGPPMTHISPTMLNVCQVWTQHKDKIINTQNIIFCVFYFHSTTHPSIKLRLHHLHYYQSLERKKLWHKKYINMVSTQNHNESTANPDSPIGAVNGIFTSPEWEPDYGNTWMEISKCKREQRPKE